MWSEIWSYVWPGGTFTSGFQAIWPNIAASIIVGTILWFWKIRPHFRRQAQHREHVRRQLRDLHRRLDDQD